jgi:hypothetical protein
MGFWGFDVLRFRFHSPLGDRDETEPRSREQGLSGQVFPPLDLAATGLACCPIRVRSLSAVILRDVFHFVEIGVEIQSFYSNLAVDAMPGAPMGVALRRAFVDRLSQIHRDCIDIGLDKTAIVIACLTAEYSTEHTHEQLKLSCTQLVSSFRDELREHKFVQFDPRRIRYLTTVEEFVQNPLFGDAVAKNFSSAMKDARDAGICYAAYRNTACVFHCMRVVERGLRALANELQIKFPVPFEYQEWHSMIDAIESAIRKLEQQPRSAAKAETLKFYAKASFQFFYFKNAWRNHVAHAREDYSDEEATMVLEHTGDFMRYLADGGLHD